MSAWIEKIKEVEAGEKGQWKHMGHVGQGIKVLGSTGLEKRAELVEYPSTI